MRFLVLVFLILSACDRDRLQIMEIPEKCQRYEPDLFLAESFKILNAVAKADCLFAPDVISKKHYRVLYSIRFDDLQIGERLETQIQVQFSNEMPKPMMLSYYWILTDSPANPDGIEGSRPKGENFDNYLIHHKVVNSTARWVSPYLGTAYANFVAFAASGEKNLENETVEIDRGYSTIFVTREK